MAERNSIWHEGIVREVGQQTIEVVIDSHSACAGCHAKGACGMSESKQKIVIAERPSFDTKAGDQVVVYASTGNAVYSVVLAYLLPSLLIIMAIFLLVRSGIGELSAAIASLVILAAYFGVLYLLKDKIGKRIKFTVEKKHDSTIKPEKLG